MTCKKLIEVAMPVKEVSAESVRDKSIRHGHISTLHLWWARRPLPVCRAVVFASLVPDPLDENCPPVFKEAVNELLGKKNNPGDPYKPYEDIPYTSAQDKMDDNERNRLLMFIGKFSAAYEKNEKAGKTTPPKEMLSEHSLIKWESKNDEKRIGKARKLIWVAHNTKPGKKLPDLLGDYEMHFTRIKKAENELYGTVDRHLESGDVKKKEANLQKAIDAFLDKMPKVFDPFAGGGAIPLEAARLGCKTYANDLNPVAHIIEKGSIEYPQKYGKPIVMSVEEFRKKYDMIRSESLGMVAEPPELYETKGKVLDIEDFDDAVHKSSILDKYDFVRMPNRLAFDVEYYARKLLALAEAEIGHFYPSDKNGGKPIAYYWVRVARCSNPSCKAEVPLLRQFYLCNKKEKQIYLKPKLAKNSISFEITKGECEEEGWVKRGNLVCPCCHNTTDVKSIKEQFIQGKTSERILAVIYEGKQGKEYRLPSKKEIEVLDNIPQDVERPKEKMQRNSAGGDTFTWGITEWGQMFSNRQLIAMHTLIKITKQLSFELNSDDYRDAIITYIGIIVDKIASFQTKFGIWEIGSGNDRRIFGRQAIAMVFDYPEGNPLFLSSGALENQIYWVIEFLRHESLNNFASICNNSASGEVTQFNKKDLTCVVTDPPYFDAIAYADLSDFYYVWLKRTLSDLMPLNFSTPQTPKAEECTALKHHHDDSYEKAKRHFEDKLLQIFKALEIQTSNLISIMFAHQSTDAWTTLCNSILNANMNITGSWSLDTELTGALKTNKSFLQSSVTVSCKPSKAEGTGAFKDVGKAVFKKIEVEVDNLYKLGFRGPDLLTACFGQAVSEFGKYEKVEKADGTVVTVAELLELARESAFNALVRGFKADDFTKFYIGWLQLNGFTETDFDDVAKFSRVGLTVNVQDLFKSHIFVQNGNKQTLATFEERNELDKKLGEEAKDPLIDKVHKAMKLYKSGNRNKLLQYISKFASAENIFWRVLTALAELLPAGTSDHKTASEMLVGKENLIKESKRMEGPKEMQEEMFG